MNRRAIFAGLVAVCMSITASTDEPVIRIFSIVGTVIFIELLVYAIIEE